MGHFPISMDQIKNLWRDRSNMKFQRWKWFSWSPHTKGTVFWQANVYFINNAVRFKLQSILICMNIVNIGLKMFRTSNQRLSDQIRRVLKTKIFAHLEISRGHHLNICGTWKFPGGLALPTPGNFQDLEISRAWKFQGCVKPS